MEYEDHRDFGNRERFPNVQTTSTLNQIDKDSAVGSGIASVWHRSTSRCLAIEHTSMGAVHSIRLHTAQRQGPKQPDCRQLHGMDSRVGVDKKFLLFGENRAFDIFLLSFQTGIK